MASRRTEIAVLERVEPLIREIRGERVMFDWDLARIYGVTTKVLNQAVKRNSERFPADFLFRVTLAELGPANRSQVVTGSQRHRDPRLLPYAFTEHGAIMAANVLRSSRAVEMSIHVIRAFVALRHEAGRYEALGRKLAELERTQKLQGGDIQVLFDAFRRLEETTSWG